MEHLAESFNVPVCPHFLMELHVSLCAAVPNEGKSKFVPLVGICSIQRKQSVADWL